MSRTKGRLVSGSPIVPIFIGGSRSKHEYEGIVDTGFSGFTLLPVALAVPLGLELDGLGVFTLADGSEQQRLTAIATVEFGSRTREVVLALEYYGSEILLGMEFLRSFEQSLVIHRDQVLLLDESDLDSSFPPEG